MLEMWFSSNLVLFYAYTFMDTFNQQQGSNTGFVFLFMVAQVIALVDHSKKFNGAFLAE